jgi:cyclopropane fatty-acyl-phospholipid synthase-like methyltransferase
MWESKYQDSEYIYGKKPSMFLVESESFLYKQLLEDKERAPQALLLGCGEGRNLVYLAKKGFHCKGVDLSRNALNKAQKLLDQFSLKAKLEMADLLKMPWSENHYDLITSLWLHLPHGARKEVYTHVKKALKPGGVFLLEAFRKEQKNYEGGPPTDKIMPSLSELQEAFKDWQIEIAQEIDREISEGKEHQGIVASVQFLVQKPIDS